MNFELELYTILEKNPYRSYKTKELARLLKIATSEYPAFKRQVKQLIAEGKITRYKKGKLGIGQKTREVVGRVHVKTQGYGFLIQEHSEHDVFISHLNMGTALNGDLVRVMLYANVKGRNLEGRIVEVIERAREHIVGTYQAGVHWGLVKPDELKIHRDIYVPIENSMNAKSGQKVVVRLEKWESEHQNPEGKIVELLGFPDEPGVDLLAIAKSFDLNKQFPPKVQQEAKGISHSLAAEMKARVDLREELCFTVDPVDSKDFDDAVSIKPLENGNFLLGVHIADVSHYVKPKSVIDEEALKRGTSVYLVNQVIPMLPEVLSNDLCSLKEGVDRLCFSVLFELTPAAEKIRYDIVRSVINSKKRFTYEEVQQIIDNPRAANNFSTAILQMYELSKKLIEKRSQRGGLDFGSHEVKIELDDRGLPIKIEKTMQLDSHRIIEEFMILANTTIAAHISKRLKQDTGQLLPFAYRVHEKPDKDKLDDFAKFAAVLGFEFPVKKQATPKLFQQFMEGIKGTEKEILVSEVLIRTMMKAKYDVKNIGHFGLALKNYCHFTSPIRRYPDLICHRLLKDYLFNPEFRPMKRAELAHICQIASEREVVALEAERASVKMKKVEYMERHLGDTFDGIISGVVDFGIFVEITENLVEGLVHISSLPKDYYIHDEQQYCLYGQHSGKIYQLGNHVRIKVIRVDRNAKIIDFELVNNY